MLAKESLRWKCPVCAASMAGMLPNAPRGGGGGKAPSDRCLPATPPAAAKMEAANPPIATDPPPTPAIAATAPDPASVPAAPAPATAVPPASIGSAAPAPVTTPTEPTPAAAPAQAVAPQADWSLYFIYGLVLAIFALLVKKLGK